MSEGRYYFQCTSNPNAPLLVLTTFWEAEEMKSHPDYRRVTAEGKPVIVEGAGVPQRIPFDGPRQTLHLPKKKA